MQLYYTKMSNKTLKKSKFPKMLKKMYAETKKSLLICKLTWKT